MSDFSTLLAVKDLMSRDVVTAPDTITVQQAARMLSEKKISSVVLTNGSGEIAGILTESDIVRHVVAEGRDATRTIAREAMSGDVHHIPGDMSIFDARHKMNALGVKHLIVEEKGKPIGLISSTALLGS